MIANKTEKIIEKLFNSLLQNYQEGLEESMGGSKFIWDSADLLHYHLKGGSYIDFPEWLKNKKKQQ